MLELVGHNSPPNPPPPKKQGKKKKKKKGGNNDKVLRTLEVVPGEDSTSGR